MRRLFDRFTLSRHGGLGDEKVFGLDDAAVGRNHVTCSQKDDIADDDVFHRNFLSAGVLPEDGRCVLDHTGQFFGGVIAARFLHETQDAGQKNHRQDDDDCHEVLFACRWQDDVGHERYGSQYGQYCRKRVDERFRKPSGKRFVFAGVNEVAAPVFPVSFYCFGVGDAIATRVVSAQDVLCRERCVVHEPLKSSVRFDCFLRSGT